ncbi:MAG: phage tail tape measure protein [Mesorhizobium sp.]|nr:MAG: phage tail tape measure protein [Mesorhizobium sp.]
MASAVIGALRVNLGIDSAQFQDGLKKAQQSLAGIGKSMTRIGAGLSAAVTAPIVAFGTSIVKTAGDFEASMSRVGAATGATAEQMASLETLARELGKTTIFSASEASDAMEVLAKNGLTVEQVLGGATKASLDLAAATGTDMASAADVASDVMLSFGKDAKDLGEVVDGITGTLLASKFGFDDYKLAIGQAGGVAGVEFEDFNAALVATSNLFASGSDAGTSFKTFLQRLVPQSKSATEAMNRLGLEFFDAQGNMKSMADIAEELRSGLNGLSEEAKTEALTDIFGTDAMRTAIGLAGTTAERFREIQSVLANASGAEQAAARLGPFNAAMEQLGGAFQELQLSIAKSGLIEFITQMVGKLTELVTYLSETNPEILKWGTVIAGLAAVLGPVVLSVGLLATGIAAIGVPVAATIAGIAALTAAVVAFWPEIQNLGTAINDSLISALNAMQSAWDGMIAKVAAVKDSLVQFASEIPGIFADLAAQMVEIGAQIIQGLWEGLKSKMAAVRDSLTGFASDLVNSVRSTLGIQSPSKVMAEIGNNIMQGLGLGMEEQKAYVVGVATDTANQAVAASKDAWAGMREVTEEASKTGDGMAGIFKSLGSSIAGLIKGTTDWKDVLADIGSQLVQMSLQNVFGNATGGAGGFFSSLFGGLLGFARGGTIMPGGAGGIDSQLVAFRKSPNERVDISKPGQTVGNGRFGPAKINLNVSVIGGSGDEHVRMLARQGAEEVVSRYNESQTRGGFGETQRRYASQKG